MAADLLEEGLARLGLRQDRVVSLIKRYIEEIELFNGAYGLVKVKDHSELVIKHIFDSLAPVDFFRKQRCKKIADIGSGAGFPGIPLAICMPDVEFTLFERMGRRAGFLRNTLAVLGLSNVRVEEADAEKLSVSETFDLIVFRAFKPLNGILLKKLFRLLAPGGIMAAYKGRRQSVEEEMKNAFGGAEAAWELLPWELIPLEVPFLEDERRLVLIRCP